MAFHLKPRDVSYYALEKAGGMTPENFRAFWDCIQLKLLEPENIIGYNGIGKCSSLDYHTWLNNFVSDGIGHLGWGGGVTKWKYGCEEDQVKYFFTPSFSFFPLL